MVGVIGEVEATLAADRANFMRAIGGGGIVILALVFWFGLLVRNKGQKISRIYLVVIGVMLVGGFALANWQDY
ncbi:MAG: hypothetical protein LH485_05080 [Sphingomonas bacterium]|nr:hypothetical protein [Sphingomonas bacterium]